MNIHAETIAYRDASTELTGVLFSNASNDSRRPGILVVHGGAGLDDHAKNRAKLLAELGYVAFVCDMYGRGVAGNRERVMAQINQLRSDPQKLLQRAGAAIDVLAARPEVTPSIAAVGYCFGGMTVLELARSGMDLAGVVSVHGSLNAAHPAQPGAVKAKLLVCHGALDPHVPPAHVNAFIEEMNHAGADWQLHIYGGAMHGFTHESGTQIPGVAYHAPSDRRSALAIQNFLAELFPLPPSNP